MLVVLWIFEAIVAAVLFALAAVAARAAFRIHVPLAAAGGERRVDLGEVNGRVFVNNVSLGLYAEAVQRSGYRDAKIRTVLDTIPDHSCADTGDHVLEFTGPGGLHGRRATVIMVSNNSYRVGTVIGSGTRPSIDDGELGIAVAEVTSKEARSSRSVRRRYGFGSRRSTPGASPSAAAPDGLLDGARKLLHIARTG